MAISDSAEGDYSGPNDGPTNDADLVTAGSASDEAVSSEPLGSLSGTFIRIGPGEHTPSPEADRVGTKGSAPSVGWARANPDGNGSRSPSHPYS